MYMCAREGRAGGGWGEHCTTLVWPRARFECMQNMVETAEQYSGGVDIAQVQAPTSTATNAELAWHLCVTALLHVYDARLGWWCDPGPSTPSRKFVPKRVMCACGSAF